MSKFTVLGVEVFTFVARYNATHKTVPPLNPGSPNKTEQTHLGTPRCIRIIHGIHEYYGNQVPQSHFIILMVVR